MSTRARKRVVSRRADRPPLRGSAARLSAAAATVPAGASTVDAAAAPLPSGRIHRFTRTERGAHWMQAISFLALLLTGFALQLPALEGLMGHRALLREIHLSSAFFFFFGPALIALSGDRRSMAEDVRDVDTWDRDDARWLLTSIGQMLGARVPRQGP